jgi:hypothetical protein
VTTDRERILSQFIDAWHAGQRPDVDDFVDRAPAEERNELADDIATFLTWAPTPAYDGAALDAIEAEPIVAEALAAARGPGGLWPSLLPRLRARAAVSTAQLASGLVDLLALPSGSQRKTEVYLERMEDGELAPAGVSRRLLDGLARLLGVARDELEGAGDLGRWQTPPAAAAPAIQFRAAPGAAEAIREDLEVLADALMPPDDDEDWDEVDELFRGGR